MVEIIDLNKKNSTITNDQIFKLLSTHTEQYKYLSISFDNDSEQIINLFFSLINNQIKKYYFVSSSYSFQVDLLENETNIELYLWFINCVDEANNIINSSKNKYLELFGSDINLWKISICKDIMFNYPFTLEDIIFFPLPYIISSFEHKEKNKIVNTLVHEKIHVCQRFNEIEWQKFINFEDRNWIKILPDSIIFKLIEYNLLNGIGLNDKEKYISNPDTFYKNFKYIYFDKTNNKYYYGNYVLDKKTNKIKKKYFQIDIENNTFIKTNKELEEEHPYEIYAYKIANELV